MFRRPASFALLVMGLLLLQWTLGSTSARRMAHGVGAIDMAQVCSVGGAGPDAAPGLPDPGPAIAEACCWACPGPTLALVPRGTPVSVPVAYATAPAPAHRPGLSIPPPLGFTPQPRAPPAVA